ncbi:hypothetical protein FH972_018805 [Carpinus fangiana]|uniref:TF-B3 domain-containing protein n=1 Tax=Carpinus fangiana TaxID=176857 RepID=A0A5N6RN56_9ROSI|nr:hypothetical protein FH972_018805 [Carpinus fangiana]
MEDRSLMEGFTLALNYTSTLQTLSNRKQRFAYHIRASLSDRRENKRKKRVLRWWNSCVLRFAAVKQRNFSGGLQDRVHLPRLAFAFVYASFLSRESSTLNSGMATSAGDADSASSGIYPEWPPPCDGHGSTEACSKCGSNKLYLPKPRAARFCPLANGSHPVSVYDVQMKRWPMRSRRSGRNAYLTQGWIRFAKENNLSVGDTITFYELKCRRETGTRVFMVGVSRKGCTQILGAPIIN